MDKLKRDKALQCLAAASLPASEDLVKAAAVQEHLFTMQMVNVYNLPFKILRDYYKKYGYKYLKSTDTAHNDSIVLLNRCYPRPGYLIDKLIGVNTSDINLLEGRFADDLNDLKLVIKDDRLKEEVESTAAEQHLWDLSTAAGHKHWEYYFAHFLASAHFDEYSYLDWWGERTPNEVMTQAQQDRIAYWKRLQRAYLRNPENYMQEEPQYLPEYEGKYTNAMMYLKDEIVSPYADMLM